MGRPSAPTFSGSSGLPSDGLSAKAASRTAPGDDTRQPNLPDPPPTSTDATLGRNRRTPPTRRIWRRLARRPTEFRRPDDLGARRGARARHHGARPCLLPRLPARDARALGERDDRHRPRPGADRARAPRPLHRRPRPRVRSRDRLPPLGRHGRRDPHLAARRTRVVPSARPAARAPCDRGRRATRQCRHHRGAHAPPRTLARAVVGARDPESVRPRRRAPAERVRRRTPRLGDAPPPPREHGGVDPPRLQPDPDVPARRRPHPAGDPLAARRLRALDADRLPERTRRRAPDRARRARHRQP